jgi:hypothetical protein
VGRFPFRPVGVSYVHESYVTGFAFTVGVNCLFPLPVFVVWWSWGQNMAADAFIHTSMHASPGLALALCVCMQCSAVKGRNIPAKPRR